MMAQPVDGAFHTRNTSATYTVLRDRQALGTVGAERPRVAAMGMGLGLGPTTMSADDVAVEAAVSSSESATANLLRLFLDKIEEQAEMVESAFANLEILVCDGYLVKVWPDFGGEDWLAHCPTVRCSAQEASRDQVVSAIRDTIREMLDVLTECGHPLPARDLGAGNGSAA